MSGIKALLESELERLYGGEAARLGVDVNDYAELVERYQDGDIRQRPALPRDADSTVLAMREDYRAPGTRGFAYIDFIAWKHPLEPWVDQVKLSVMQAAPHPLVEVH